MVRARRTPAARKNVFSYYIRQLEMIVLRLALLIYLPYSLENNVALYSYNADRNSYYTRGRVILKVVLYRFMSTLISVPIKFFESKTNFLSNGRSFPYGLMAKFGLFIFSRPKYIALYRGRTILKVALYENSGAIFSHYIWGRVII